MTEKNKRGGPGRDQGRKPIQAGAASVAVMVRMTAGQREKLKALGGPPWIRDRITKATVKS